MKKEKQQKRPKRTKAQRVQALKTFAVDTVYDVVGSILFAIGVYTFAKSADFAPGGVSGLAKRPKKGDEAPSGLPTAA